LTEILLFLLSDSVYMWHHWFQC